MRTTVGERNISRREKSKFLEGKEGPKIMWGTKEEIS